MSERMRRKWQIENEALQIILSELDTLFGVEPERAIENEMEVLVALEFSLFIPYDQYIEHIFWILRKLDSWKGWCI